MVAIPWVSFLMDTNNVTAKIILQIIAFFVALNLERNSTAPKVSYVTAIGIWIGICTAFVFCALVESTVVDYLCRAQDTSKATVKQIPRCKNIDNWYRIVFPVGFLVFIIFFWSYFSFGI